MVTAMGSTMAGSTTGELVSVDAKGRADSTGGGATRRWRRSARKGRQSDRWPRRVREKGEESGDGKRKPQIY